MNNLKIFLPLILLVGMNNLLNAQPQLKDSTEAYKYWAHRGIVEMVYAYMNDYIETVGEQKAKAEINGKNLYEQKFIIGIDNKDLPTFEDISSFLIKNNWNGTEKKLFQPLKKNIENSVKLDSKLFEAKKPGSDDLITDIPGHVNKRIYWEKQRENILSNYSNSLQNLAERHKPQETIVSQPSVQEEKLPKNNPVERHKNVDNAVWLKWFNYLALFLLGLLFGGWLVFFISKQKIYSILDFEKDKYLHDLRLSDKTFIFKYVGLFYVLKKRKEDYKNEIDSQSYDKTSALLKEQIQALKKENLELKQKQVNEISIKQTQSSDDKKSNNHEWDIEKPQRTKQKLFFSMPENDGRFIIDNGELSNNGRKYFRIEFVENSDNGELFYISSERDKRAINRLESYLKPVCEIDNIANSENATRIEFVNSGKVVLRNNSWLIVSDKKVKIKLI